MPPELIEVLERAIEKLPSVYQPLHDAWAETDVSFFVRSK
jgi:hypothetical protein